MKPVAPVRRTCCASLEEGKASPEGTLTGIFVESNSKTVADCINLSSSSLLGRSNGDLNIIQQYLAKVLVDFK